MITDTHQHTDTTTTQVHTVIANYFKETTDTEIQDCRLSKHFAKWASTAQKFWFKQTGNETSQIKHRMGDLPKLETTQLMKPTEGDLRQLILPGGGSLALKMWAGMRVKA